LRPVGTTAESVLVFHDSVRNLVLRRLRGETLHMQERVKGMVDLLEIYHARRLRDQVIGQLKRLADAETAGQVSDARVLRHAARYYEAALVTVAALLDSLGDRRPYD